MRPIKPPINAKATVGRGECTKQSNNNTDIFTQPEEFIKADLLSAKKIRFINFLSEQRAHVSTLVWRLTYATEEARQHYANTRQLLKQATACIALYFLRMVG